MGALEDSLQATLNLVEDDPFQPLQLLDNYFNYDSPSDDGDANNDINYDSPSDDDANNCIIYDQELEHSNEEDDQRSSNNAQKNTNKRVSKPMYKYWNSKRMSY
jgi:hypothetical protein